MKQGIRDNSLSEGMEIICLATYKTVIHCLVYLCIDLCGFPIELYIYSNSTGFPKNTIFD